MRIKIKNLKVHTEIGVFESEQGTKQDLIINVKYVFDGEKSTQEDMLKNTIDYHPLAENIVQQVESNKFYLIEYLASFVMDIVMNYDSRIMKASVEVDKPNAIAAADAASVKISAKR